MGEGEGPGRVEGVLGGDDHEGTGQGMGGAVGRDLALLHGLEESGLGLGGGPVELVGQEDVGEDGAGAEGQDAGVTVEDDGPGDVGREEVGRQLDPAEAETEGTGQGLGQGGLAHAGVVLDQEMALGEEAAEGKADGEVLAQVGGADVGHHRLEGLGQLGHRSVGGHRTVGRQGPVHKRSVVHTTLYVYRRHLVHLRPPLPTLVRVHGGSLCASSDPKQGQRGGPAVDHEGPINPFFARRSGFQRGHRPGAEQARPVNLRRRTVLSQRFVNPHVGRIEDTA